ncbi:hypothetical protein JGU66_04820 [Myxococcaceae bacterium JPH2]|nr:hypothetical protein [Myxococcaceae bacterium JPH2]
MAAHRALPFQAFPSLAPEDVERAVSLLERIFSPRNPGGHNTVYIPKTLAASDLDWLRGVGLDPNTSLRLTHDEAVAAVVAARERYTIAEGVEAFVSSLDNVGAPPHGCFLEAVLLAHGMPAHPMSSPREDPATAWCRVCGLSPELLVRPASMFAQWQTGGSGIPGRIEWALVALGQLESWKTRVPTPLAKARLAHVVKVLDGLAPDTPPGGAFGAVQALGLDKAAARSIVETLAFAGVLEAPPHEGMATRFVSFAERDQRPSVRVEVDAPLGFWRGRNGVQWTNAQTLFGLSRDMPLPPLEQPAAHTPAKKKAAPKKPGAAERKKTLPRRPPAKGDVWALRIREDAWALLYVWTVKEQAQRPYARCEFIETLSLECPTSVTPPLTTRPRYDGRWQYWASGLEKVTGSALIAENVPEPTAKEPVPERLSHGGAKDLPWLASSCFDSLDD